MLYSLDCINLYQILNGTSMQLSRQASQKTLRNEFVIQSEQTAVEENQILEFQKMEFREAYKIRNPAYWSC
jgi:hypothetical protein